MPLLELWVKSNTDGSCKDSELADSEWFGGFDKGVGICSVYMAEFWEVFEVLKYARRLEFRAVELNVYSFVVF